MFLGWKAAFAKRQWLRRVVGAAVLVISLQAPCIGAQSVNPAPGIAPLRAPAVPLVTHNPYFSIWSMTDELTEDNTRHWTGQEQAITGLVRVDGEVYRWMGNGGYSSIPPAPVRLNGKLYSWLGGQPGKHDLDAVPVMAQVRRQLTPTRTIYDFQTPEISLEVTFLQPALPRDLETLSRPVTYLIWKAQSRDGKTHEVEIYVDAAATIAVGEDSERVIWSRFKRKGLDLVRVGTLRQPVLVRSGDQIRIDYGWFYLAAPRDEAGLRVRTGNWDDLFQFITDGTGPADDDLEGPRAANSIRPPAPGLIAIASLGAVGAQPVERHILLAYDDVFEVEYLQRKLLPLWRKYYSDAGAMLDAAEKDYGRVREESAEFDRELEGDLVKAGGPEYAAIAVLAYQQAFAACGYAEDVDGSVYVFAKENHSNGSISTVDVIYPSSPIFLLLNPKLLEAQMTPVFGYARLPRWKFPFAPHDLGRYPLANGQLYGGGESSEVDQMPVEESANMILLSAAPAQIEGNAEYAGQHWALLGKWAEYLAAQGFDPANQLCTDDSTGHLAHNVNLSLKAIEALGAYAQLARELGHEDEAQKYRAMAEQMAAKWQVMALDGNHYKLAFDQPGTWSQLYNLAWNQVLGLGLFPTSVRARAIAFYKTKVGDRDGLPLDSRSDFAHLDWTSWTATLATNQADFEYLIHGIYHYWNTTPDRVPMPDAVTHHPQDQARSVVGAVYMKMLSDPALWEKWAKGKPSYASVGQSQ